MNVISQILFLAVFWIFTYSAYQSSQDFKFIILGGVTSLAIVVISLIKGKNSSGGTKNKELDQSNQLLKTTIDSIPGTISLLDSELTYKVVNKNLVNIFKIPEKEILGKKVGFQGKKNPLVQYLLNFSQGNKNSETSKFQIPLPNGTSRWHLVTLSKAPYGDIVWISLDIHDSVEKEHELNTQRAMMVHNNQLSQIGEFLGSVAHEINNPLTVMRVTSDLLKDSISNNPQNVPKLLEKIDSNISRTEKIVQGLKNKVRQTSNDPMEPVSIDNLISEVMGMVEHKLELTSTPLTIEKDPGLKVVGRQVELEQVFTNLVKNSIEAIDKDPKRWIKVQVKETSTSVKISVTDSGPGIPAEIRQKMMDPFFTTKPVGIGTGLGLAVCSKIIQDHKGQLYVDEKNSNTCFVVEIPKKA